jgi:hypothetical protein
VLSSHPQYGVRSSIPARPRKNIFREGTPELASPCRLFGRRNQTALAPYKAILKQRCVRFNGNRRGMTMHGRRNLTQDAGLRAQIAMANRLIAEQSAAIATAHSAIERAMESLREPDGEGPNVLGWANMASAEASQ